MIVGTLATAIAAFLSIKMPRWYLAPPLPPHCGERPAAAAQCGAWAEAGASTAHILERRNGLNLWTFVAGEAVGLLCAGPRFS